MLCGCGGTWMREHPLYCRLDEQRLVRDTLYFGRARPDGSVVSDADWDAFTRDTLASVFPTGYTVIDAHGRWRGDDVAEASRLVIVLHADDAASDAKVARVADDYRRRFAQEAVLRERDTVCAKF